MSFTNSFAVLSSSAGTSKPGAYHIASAMNAPSAKKVPSPPQEIQSPETAPFSAEGLFPTFAETAIIGNPIFGFKMSPVADLGSAYRVGSSAPPPVSWNKLLSPELAQYQPNRRFGCCCPFQGATDYVHRCAPKKKNSERKPVPTGPKNPVRPSGKYYTRSQSHTDKSNLVSYASTCRTGGPIGRPKKRFDNVSTNWRQDRERGSSWGPRTNNESWAMSQDDKLAVTKFQPKTWDRVDRHNKKWTQSTYIANPLDSDAYRQHHLGIQPDKDGRTPFPPEVKVLRQKGKVKIPLINKMAQLTLNTGAKMGESRTKAISPYSSSNTQEGGDTTCQNLADGWWYRVSATNAETRARGGFLPGEEGQEISRVINEYCNDMKHWEETGRLPGRYKDRPNTLLPKTGIFDVPIDDTDDTPKKVHFKKYPVTNVCIYIPDGDYNMSPTPKLKSSKK